MSAIPLTSRQTTPDGTIVQVGPVPVGGERLVVIAGPCSVETEEQLLETAGFSRWPSAKPASAW